MEIILLRLFLQPIGCTNVSHEVLRSKRYPTTLSYLREVNFYLERNHSIRKVIGIGFFMVFECFKSTDPNLSH